MMDFTNQPIDLSFREEAFLCFDAVKRDRKQESQAILERMVFRLKASEANALDSAYWLWAAGEYANQNGDKAIIEASNERIATYIDLIERSWNKPDQHWLREGETGLFLSNLAIYYGALRSISNLHRSESAQRICKEIRELTFAAFMRGNHFISRQGSEEVWEDIIAAAVPFGLVSAGDLAMLDAISYLQEADIKDDAAALMSWFYSESGQLVRAKQFLDKATEGSTSDSVLITLAANHLAQKVAGLSNAQGIHFNHDPLGSESPYIFANNERSPRLVTQGEKVTIRTFVEPFDVAVPVNLEVIVNHAEAQLFLMEAVQTPEGEQFWEAVLVPFDDFSEVQYRFAVIQDNQAYDSEWFKFEVLRWLDIDKVVYVAKADRQVAVYLDSPLQGGYKSVLTIGENVDGLVNCQFALVDQVALKSFENAEVDGCYSIGNVDVRVAGASLSLHVINDEGEDISSTYPTEQLPLLQMLVDQSGRVYKLHLNFKLVDEERLYGMGERFARMEFRGCEVDNYVFNQYKDQGFKTYIPVPFVLSTNGYGLFLQSSLYSVFKFGTVQTDLLQIEADIHDKQQSLSWFLFTGEPKELVAKFTSISGKPKLPPKWAFGPWMSSNNWDSEKEVDWQLAQTKKHGIPATVMVIEQWSDESTFYIFNDAQYVGKPGEERFSYDDFTFPEWGRWPNPKKLVERIHDQGIKLLMWQAPVMKFMDGIAHLQRDEDEKVMIEKGYGVRNTDGSPYRIPSYEWFRNSMVPDFTNPASAAWWFSKRQYLLDEMKIDGFKTDGGECIYGSDVQFHDGRKGAEMRNEYPNSYIKAFYDYTNQHVEGGGITFSRAGYTGSQNMPLHWAGDEKSTFDAFRSSIMAGLNSGLSGISFWGWDLGGFSGEIPTAELFIRSVQMAAFCPVMQYHAESIGEFNLDRTPWNIAERSGVPAVLEIYKQYADLRMNLLPYIYEQAQLSANTGYPLMQAMLLAFPHDPLCLELTNQYMFGQHLLVVPIAEEGATKTEVYLPAGSWLNLFNSEVIAGGRLITASADISQIPVFIKENSVIPLNLNHTYELSSDVGSQVNGYDQLTLLVYVTSEADYHFADDLGNSISLSVVKKSLALEASIEITGEYPVTLLFRGLGTVAGVKLKEVAQASVVDLEIFKIGSYLQRCEDMLITIQQGMASIRIEL
ncbi:hypothetical protein EHS13_20825 [Paenibacillus psychroresistens]|uniref:Uncharacterized protein n=1 Tax=Paenibacillus psychroresistens TaxID=1778678 RepID=A0A6B8RP56_9BACL|nr:TIM-barrel domain-containing protein [Paenibacillus psychroresistens]QGQ97156.1 hypothetical protein EHS13_20825 [Paenibacillus psychroresistens]